LFSKSWISEGVFVENHANWGGGSAAWFKQDQATNFCSNCTYINNTASYQTEEGFATQPTLTSILSACPSKINLNEGPFTIQISLLDDFSSQISGRLRFLDDNIFVYLLNYCRKYCFLGPFQRLCLCESVRLSIKCT
jgi:hypothetical protein